VHILGFRCKHKFVSLIQLLRMLLNFFVFMYVFNLNIAHDLFCAYDLYRSENGGVVP
jgi:hypothetical protein